MKLFISIVLLIALVSCNKADKTPLDSYHKANAHPYSDESNAKKIIPPMFFLNIPWADPKLVLASKGEGC